MLFSQQLPCCCFCTSQTSGDWSTSVFPIGLILYGVGAALTLDEFALWLNLQDVYWARQGRESIDAVILFGAILAAGAWGAPLFTPKDDR